MTLRPSRHALTATRAAQERQGEHGRSMHTSARLACCRVPLGSRATKTVLSLASLGATLLCGTHDGAILLVRAGAIVGEVALARVGRAPRRVPAQPLEVGRQLGRELE